MGIEGFAGKQHLTSKTRHNSHQEGKVSPPLPKRVAPKTSESSYGSNCKKFFARMSRFSFFNGEGTLTKRASRAAIPRWHATFDCAVVQIRLRTPTGSTPIRSIFSLSIYLVRSPTPSKLGIPSSSGRKGRVSKNDHHLGQCSSGDGTVSLAKLYAFPQVRRIGFVNFSYDIEGLKEANVGQ